MPLLWSAPVAAAVRSFHKDCSPRHKLTPSKVVEGLFPAAEKGMKILFCEPSCLSAVKEDAPSLLRGEAAEERLEL